MSACKTFLIALFISLGLVAVFGQPVRAALPAVINPPTNGGRPLCASDQSQQNQQNSSDTSQQTVWANVQCTPSVVTIWEIVLSFVDFIVVAGLIIAAFANILNININTYGVKQILPGLIIGIVLANLSYFIMHFFIEVTTVSETGVASIISNYMPDYAWNEASGAVYLADTGFKLLGRSLIIMPASVLTDSLHVPTSLTAQVGGTLTLTAVLSVLTFGWAGVIVIILYVLLVFIPLVLLLILLFLLYIRNYVLLIMFMTAPLAFFALGFPPLKRLWQMWWGTFWKWLLMAPIALAILGFADLILHAYVTNPKVASSTILDFIFFNGLAILLFYWASRIPFQLGPALFGVNALNVMPQWAKLGKNTTRQGFMQAKRLADKYQTNRVQDKYQGAKTRGFWGPRKGGIYDSLERDKADKEKLAKYVKDHKLRIDLDQYKDKDADALYGAVKTQLLSNEATEIKEARKRNILRAPESIYAAYNQNRQIMEEEEKKAITKSVFYGGEYAPLRYHAPDRVRAATLLREEKEDAKNIESIRDLQDHVRKVIEKLGLGEAGAIEYLDTASSAWSEGQQMEAILERGPFADAIHRGDITEKDAARAIAYMIQGRSIGGRSTYRDDRERVRGVALKNGYIGAGQKVPDGKAFFKAILTKEGATELLKGVSGSTTSEEEDSTAPHAASAPAAAAPATSSPPAAHGAATATSTASATRAKTIEDEVIHDITSGHVSESDLKGSEHLYTEGFMKVMQLAHDSFTQGVLDEFSDKNQGREVARQIWDNIATNVRKGEPSINRELMERLQLSPAQQEAIIKHARDINLDGRLAFAGQVRNRVLAQDQLSTEKQIALTRLRQGITDLSKQLPEFKNAIKQLKETPNLTTQQLDSIRDSISTIHPLTEQQRNQQYASPEQYRQSLLNLGKNTEIAAHILTQPEVQQAAQTYGPSDPRTTAEVEKITDRMLNQKMGMFEVGLKTREAIEKSPDGVTMTPDMKQAVVNTAKQQVRSMLLSDDTTNEALAQMPADQQESSVQQVAQNLVDQISQGAVQKNDKSGEPTYTSPLHYVRENEADLHEFLIDQIRRGFAPQKPIVPTV